MIEAAFLACILKSDNGQAGLPPDLVDFGGHDMDATTVAVKGDVTFYQCKKGVILALANVFPRMESISNLSYEDVAWVDQFTTKFLDTTSLCVGVTTVSARALTFLMGH